MEMMRAGSVFNLFTFAKVKLVLEEKKMIGFLSQGHHNIDYTFALNFKEPKDSRDERPPIYTCRMPCSDVEANK